MTGRLLTLSAIALLSYFWTADAQAGPLRYRGPQDPWHGSYYTAPAYGSYYTSGYGGHHYAPTYGGVYSYAGSGYSYPVLPTVTPSYYYAPIYPAGGYYSGFGHGGHYGGGYYGGGYYGTYHHHH